jgi:hypothetical protein
MVRNHFQYAHPEAIAIRLATVFFIEYFRCDVFRGAEDGCVVAAFGEGGETKVAYQTRSVLCVDKNIITL